MSGALKPPWVSKEVFYRLPFNFCDRWCEKCGLTGICRVFKDEAKSRRRFLKRGKDPDSMECVLERIKETFEKIDKLLEEDMKRLGIRPEDIDEGENSSFPNAEQSPLCRLTDKFSQKLEDLTGEAMIFLEETDQKIILDNFEIISHQRLLLPPKIYRATLSKWEEEKDKEDTVFDSKTSAFIAINVLAEITEALLNLKEYKVLKPSWNKFLRLAKLSTELSVLIEEEFDIAGYGKN